MENAVLLASVMGPIYVVLGLSILFYVKVWGKLVDKFAKDHLSLLSLMFMHLVLGLISVGMFNVWEFNVWLLVTLTGWGMLLKGVAYFLLPGDMLTSMMKIASNNAGLLYFGGLVATVIGAVLSYNVYFM